MIVRIATEGQYELSDDRVERLHQLDEALHEAAQSGDEERFRASYDELLAFVRGEARILDDDHLGGSDLILPPPDVSAREAAQEFTGQGLLPD